MAASKRHGICGPSAEAESVPTVWKPVTVLLSLLRLLLRLLHITVSIIVIIDVTITIAANTITITVTPTGLLAAAPPAREDPDDGGAHPSPLRLCILLHVRLADKLLYDVCCEV